MTKHRFKTIHGAVRRVRELEKQVAELQTILGNRIGDLVLVAKLARAVPDRVLSNRHEKSEAAE